MNIGISGSSGLVGSALKKYLEGEGHTTISLPRTFENPIDFSTIDAVIHLAGESIASGRWTPEKKARIEESRVLGTRQLAKQLASAKSSPSIFISASAIGYYGSREDEILDENSSRGNDFLSDVCEKWEAATSEAEEAGIRTVKLRTGIVLSNRGGALQKMLPPFKFGGGGILGSGKQYMSWISLDDMVQGILHSIETESLVGPVNFVAPNPVTNYTFTKTLGKILHRPTFLPLPAFAARIIFGEMADALLLSSTRVTPKKLVESGYTFKHENLQSALKDILK